MKKKISFIILFGISVVSFILLCVLFLGQVSYYTSYVRYGEYKYSNYDGHYATFKVDEILVIKPNNIYTYEYVYTLQGTDGEEYVGDRRNTTGLYSLSGNSLTIREVGGSNASYVLDISDRNALKLYDIPYYKQASGLEIFLIITIILPIVIIVIMLIYNRVKKRTNKF